MKIQKQINTHIVLIGLLVVIGQLSVLNHAVEHPFHTQDPSCEIFLQCEKSGDELVAHDVKIPDQTGNIQADNRLASLWLSTPTTHYSSRAPPFLS